MLQKYHPNPLSHFLALHNSQATHNHVVDAHTLATTLANSHSQFHQQQLHQQQQQQQQQQHHHQHQPQHQHHQHQQTAAALLAANHQHSAAAHIQLAAAAAATQHLNSNNSPNHIHSPTHHNAPTTHPHNAASNPNHHNHHHQHHIANPQRHHHSSHTQQLIEAAAAVNTTLDAGKSFTIAAILGLQKSAMENSCKEYTNNVINLSLNGGSNNNSNTSHHSDGNGNGNGNGNNSGSGGNGNITGQHLLLQHQQLSASEQRNKDEQLHQQPQQQPLHHQHQQQHQQQHQHHSNQRDSLSHNNNNNNRDVTNLNVNKSNICNSFPTTAADIITSTASLSHPNTVNSYNCDNVSSATATATAAAATVLMNRYLPSAMVNVTGAVATPSIASFAASPVMAHQQHSRANSFVAAAAVAAAAGAPSALQSLQQLHQQHAAHQTSLSFQREKLKSESNSKKSSLKNKRVRTIFTPEQLERLEAEFERQQYMVGPERLYLAHTLQLTEAQVKVWFQNRRIKWRKHHLEITQQRLALLRQTQIAPGGSMEQATVKVDGTDDEDFDNIKREELRDLNDSRQDTESELSVCNDSMDADAESIIDDDEET